MLDPVIPHDGWLYVQVCTKLRKWESSDINLLKNLVTVNNVKPEILVSTFVANCTKTEDSTSAMKQISWPKLPLWDSIFCPQFLQN